ncbi:MAG: hypothetical protein OEN01_15140 [Candidatus Krumholzibacteria bacterium]|nr:hypothetical protein [Candidatus Krumholzibacteria bacterium]
MGQDIEFWEAVKKIRAKDNRFKPEAYPFVMESLEYTIQRVGERRHVTALELLDGLCLYSKQRFGLLAPDVLENWGIQDAFDVGLAVFHLVEAGVLARQDSDQLEDFQVNYDLWEMLGDEYFA